MLQAAFRLPDCREARTLSGRGPSRAGAAGRPEQRGRSGARHLLPVASDQPQPGCPWFSLQEVTLGCRARQLWGRSDGHTSGPFLLWGRTSLAPPQVGKSWNWTRPAILSKDRKSFTQVPCFCKIVESVCVCLEMASSFYLRVSVCVCARSSRSCLRSSISEQSSPPLQRGTLLSTSACLKTFLRFWFLTRVHPVCTQSP